MPRPCTCERHKSGQEYTLDQCRPCWLYHNDIAYKNLYDQVEKPEPKKIILNNGLSLGDVLVMEAAISSLHKVYPNTYITGVDTTANQVYENHPYVVPLEPAEAELIKMNYTAGIDSCDKRPIHFMQGYCDMLGSHLGIKLPCVVKTPKLYISDTEKSWMNQVHEKFGWKGKFWLLGAASWKTDYTIKKTSKIILQEVVDYYKNKILFVQVGAKHQNNHKLNGVVDLVGETDTRQLIRLAHWASGALVLESFLHHAMAALSKPCVTLASGFLPIYWVSYPTSVILTSQGQLPCCQYKPCWKSRVIKLNDGDDKDKSLCELPMLGDDPTAKCMTMITADEIIMAIDKFISGGVVSY